MGISFSCPFASDNDVESGLQSIIVRSVSLGDKEMKTPERSISFKDDSESKSESQSMMIIKKSLDSGKMIVEGSVSFKQREMGTLISVVTPCLSQSKLEGENGICMETKSHQTPPQSPKHEAAVKLQKVYKSFRTRRKLADCAVLVEQRWWKLLDFAELKHSSISFFDVEHHETAISRWSRAKTRAAKVGKGLSKNVKARKLALQHWLEAIDPRHRYGHNLHFYYAKWLESQSREPFFYWLDIGEGKELNLDKCPRCNLQQQCIKYLGPMERRAYEVAFEDGKFFYKQSGELLDTSSEPRAKWIFVLSTSKALYVGKKKKGTFQHSSFLAGGATSAAGRLVVENGILKAVWPHSGHYRPTPENFQEFISFLRENNVDLTDVKMDPVDEDDRSLGKQRSSLHVRNNSEEEVALKTAAVEVEVEERNVKSIAGDEKQAAPEPETAVLQDNAGSIFSRKLSHLQIPSRDDLLATMQSENPTSDPAVADHNVNATYDDDGYDSSAEDPSLSEEDDEQVDKEGRVDEEEHDQKQIIPAEAILKRINSHKDAKSYQLGKQLSCKWTTGAGPRIGCVRDYPSELQFRALEQVNLSPRSALRCQMKLLRSPAPSPKAPTPNPNSLVSHRSLIPGQYRLQSSPLSIQRKPTL